MKKVFFPLIAILIVSCSKPKVAVYFTNEKATGYFRDIEALCKKENGRLWGKNLYGPLMFVDRPSRKIFANQPDKEGILKEKDGIYIGDYPREQVIQIQPKEFGGTMFSVAILPPLEDAYRIKRSALRSLIHSFQKERGLIPASFNTKHMDEKTARMWLKLEWRALKKALNNESEMKEQAIRDALIFKGARRELYPTYANDENKFEDYEGLATFSALEMMEDTAGVIKRRLIEGLDRAYNFQSFGASYGSIQGSLYSYLAYEAGFDFKTIHTDSLDLGEVVRSLYKIQLPEICRDVAGSLALSYDIESIYKEEDQRLASIKERRLEQLSVYTEKPIVYLELESPYFDFEPEDLNALDTLGTIYATIRVSDNWGKLTVEKGGCLVASNLKYIRIPAKNITESKNHLSGDGWNLIINNNWEIVKVGQNYFVRKP